MWIIVLPARNGGFAFIILYVNLTASTFIEERNKVKDKKVLELVDRYEIFFKGAKIPNTKHPHDKHFNDNKVLLAHCYSMLKGIRDFISSGDSEKRDRALIRLGFVHGGFCAGGIFTVEDLKNHTQPEGYKHYDPSSLEPLTHEDLQDWEY